MDTRSLLIDSGADPWIVQHDGFYYYCRVDKDDSYITVSKSESLAAIGNSERINVWFPAELAGHEERSKQLWAPELHYVMGKWYIYYAADDGDNTNHRMYALESTTHNPQGKYEFKGQVTSLDNHWAIDGTILQFSSKLYFIWSGWEGSENLSQNLYIAPMSDPWTISGSRVCIAKPKYQWEHSIDPPINEGPEILQNKGNLFIIYSAASVLTDDYCLGQLRFTGNNILDPEAWLKSPLPVFKKTANIFAPGHASFVKSLDGSEDLIVYHTARHNNSGYDRQVRTKKFSWNLDGSPCFGVPV